MKPPPPGDGPSLNDSANSAQSIHPSEEPAEDYRQPVAAADRTPTASIQFDVSKRDRKFFNLGTDTWGPTAFYFDDYGGCLDHSIKQFQIRHLLVATAWTAGVLAIDGFFSNVVFASMVFIRVAMQSCVLLADWIWVKMQRGRHRIRGFTV